MSERHPCVLIVKVGSTFPDLAAQRGDYEDWFAAGLGLPSGTIRLVSPHEGEALPDPKRFDGVVVTGSSAMVSHRAPWSEHTAAWLADEVVDRVPVLGVCYGHQLLAHGLGGEVAANPNGRQIGTLDVTLTEAAGADPLLGVLPDRAHLPVTHRESVLKLPANATRLAHTPRDPNHAFAVGDRTWAVQFHPEFDASIIRAYIARRKDAIRQEGQDPDALSEAARDTDHGKRLLSRFATLIRS